jgi:putative protease
MGRNPEILAPAGGREQFLAAIGAGADAVYLGLKEFNARARASNFTLEELSSLMPIARKTGLRVLVTLNVLIKQQELTRLLEILSELQWLGVFAVIVQDPGTVRVVREYFPALRIHASTQMAIHNVEGVLMAREMGIRRVVLARELTLREIARIREALPREEMEIEAFCHGSLCYSYSGLCFFSGAEDARSGNRGECAYTCRQPYKLIGEPGFGFLFSMKDLDTSHLVAELVEAGVDALKIEGRKKDAQFVASSVGLYREQLSKLPGSPALDRQREGRNYRTDLDYSYQRDTTSFFLEGRYYENVIDLNNPTHKGGLAGIVRETRGRQVHLRTSLPLELYDGIRIDRPEQRFHAEPQHGKQVEASFESARKFYRNEICEFSLRELFSKTGRIHSAQSGDEVILQIPPGQDLPAPGDLVFKVRSNELKRHVDALVQEAASLERERPLRNADLTISLKEADGVLEICATAHLAGREFASANRSVPAQRPRTPSRLSEDIQTLFRIIGDASFEMTVHVTGDADWFVPAGELKALRRDLAAALPDGVARLSRASLAEAAGSIRAVRPAKEALPNREPHYQVKLDRLESLDAVCAFAATHPSFRLDEIVFEPKRMFLGRLNGAQAFAEIQKRLPPNTALRIALPVVLRTWDRPGLQELIRAAADAGCTFEAGNPGALRILREFHRPVAGDFTMYALNSVAADELAELGLTRLALSVEDDLANLKEHIERWPDTLQAQAIVYKDTPLFIAEACSLTALHNGCPTSRVCGYRTLEIENEKGERFYVAHEQCKSIVYGKRPYSITHRIAELQKLGVWNFRADFLTREYSPQAIEAVLAAMQAERTIPASHEANYARSLL